MPKGKVTKRRIARLMGESAALAMEHITAKRTMLELARIGFSDIGQVVDEQDRLLPLRELPPDIRAAVASMKRTKQNLTVGDGEQEDVVEVKLWNKPQALEMLAKHFKLITEVMEVNASEDLLKLLDEGRQRIAAAKKARESR